MNDSNILDFAKVCRGCLSDKIDTFQPLYNFETKDIFISCTSILVSYIYNIFFMHSIKIYQTDFRI